MFAQFFLSQNLLNRVDTAFHMNEYNLILRLCARVLNGGNVDTLCSILGETTVERLEGVLTAAGVSASVQAQLIQCLLNAGITFATIG